MAQITPPSPIPEDEAERLEEVLSLRMLDTPPEERFERIIRIAEDIFGVPISFISLIDVKRVWFKACHGLSVSECSRDISFCAYTILSNQPLIVNDALQDPRFMNNPLVKGPPFMRFYAGYPLRGPRGHRVGTICNVDFVPREMSEDDINILRNLAHLVESEVLRTVEENKLQQK